VGAALGGIGASSSGVLAPAIIYPYLVAAR
jgi:hypothetical protein